MGDQKCGVDSLSLGDGRKSCKPKSRCALRVGSKRCMANAGFEPAPFQTSALNWRLRPLGQLTTITPDKSRSQTRSFMTNNNAKDYTRPSDAYCGVFKSQTREMSLTHVDCVAIQMNQTMILMLRCLILSHSSIPVTPQTTFTSNNTQTAHPWYIQKKWDPILHCICS